MAEISANVHSAEAIAPEIRSAVLDGLELVGQYVGLITVGDQLVGPLPPSQLEVDSRPTKDMYAHLDPSIDLHLFLAPGQLETTREKISGLAHKDAGVAWMSNDIPAKVLTVVTAHEVGHALGYVNPNSKQADRSSHGHCQDPDCIMRARISMESPEDFPGWSPEFLKGVFGIEELPTDFCEPCQGDMQRTSDIHIGMIRTSRRFMGIVTPELLRLSGPIG